MKTFNVLYDKNANLESLVSTLTGLNVTVQTMLTSSSLLIVTAADDTFATTTGVLHVEEDVTLEVTPEYFWHQLRVGSEGLPMRASYFPAHNGQGKTAYVVDSGINTEHTEFSTAVTENRIINLHSYNSTFADELSHGTSIASLIVGDTLGVSPKATVKNVKIPVGTTTVSVLLAAFDAVLADHLATPEDVKVVNCSWTVPRSYLLDLKISELQQNNLLVVAAAGNQGAAAVNYSPVGLNTVMGVAASDAYDRVISWGGASSNFGPEVDITAPGIEVDVLMSNGTFSTSSGTSLAAAVVTGVALQYIGAEPTKSASNIQDTIIENAVSDILFRNETVYGTTPNKMLYVQEVGPFILPVETYKIKNGESVTYTIGVRKPNRGLTSEGIEVKTASTPGALYSFWPFVTINNEVELEDRYEYTVTVAPVDITPGRYLMALKCSAPGSNNFINDMFYVYDVDITECDTMDRSPYVYGKDESGDIVVTLAAECNGSGGCPKGYFCCLGGNCCYCLTNCNQACIYESPPCTT